MSAPAFPTTVDSKTAAVVRYHLAQRPALAAYFGADAIREMSYAETRARLPAPFLAVIPAPVKDLQLTSGQAGGIASVLIQAFLQRESPHFDSSLTPPDLPTLADGGAGVLTGAYRYRLTGYTSTAETFATDLTDAITVTAKQITVTIPAASGFTGLRLWRTGAGKTAARFRALVAPGEVLVDNRPDSRLEDELAPEKFAAEKLCAEIKCALADKAMLSDIGTGLAQSDMVIDFKEAGDTVSAERNQRIKAVLASFTIHYNFRTRVSNLETL